MSHREAGVCGDFAQKTPDGGRPEGPAELLGRVPGASQGLRTALKIAVEPGSQENTGFSRNSWP